MAEDRNLYIVSGPNGAGKTTASYTVLPRILQCREFVNADEKAHRQGYNVTLLYFWLHSPELALQRVAERVSKGGHNVAEHIVRRRYYEGIRNFFNIYAPIVDTWVLADNSITPREIIATGGMGVEADIHFTEKYNKLIEICQSKNTRK